MLFPQSAAIAEGIDHAFGADPGAGQDDDVSGGGHAADMGDLAGIAKGGFKEAGAAMGMVGERTIAPT